MEKLFRYLKFCALAGCISGYRCFTGNMRGSDAPGSYPVRDTEQYPQ